MRLYVACLLTILLLCGPVAPDGSAQEVSCSDIPLLGRMARTPSAEVLSQLKAKVGNTYLAKLVFASRMIEIRGVHSASASALAELIPKNPDQDRLWHSLEGFLCDHESLADVKALGGLQARLPHDVAKAISARPGKMFDFVSYAYDSVQDPHSDYAVQMRIVCRRHHRLFENAVNQMAEKDRSWFATKIFDPVGCRAIALPEAD